MSDINHYEKLRLINITAQLKKKGGFSYLSWAWAVDQLLQEDPMATWEYADPKMFGMTMMVFCSVTAFGKTMNAHLPVLKFNKPVDNPNAFDVNTAMQRCLVKAIALHGIGLSIYAGEDLWELEETSSDEPAKDERRITSAQAKLLKERMDAINPDLVANTLKKRDLKSLEELVPADYQTLLKFVTEKENAAKQ